MIEYLSLAVLQALLAACICRSGGTADAVDSKSTGGDIVRVQIPSPAFDMYIKAHQFILVGFLSISW